MSDDIVARLRDVAWLAEPRNENTVTIRIPESDLVVWIRCESGREKLSQESWGNHLT